VPEGASAAAGVSLLAPVGAGVVANQAMLVPGAAFHSNSGGGARHAPALARRLLALAVGE